MFRERTNLYLSYRRTFPHANRFSTESENEFDDYSDGYSDDGFDINNEDEPMLDLEANPRPRSKRNPKQIPRFILVTNEIDTNLVTIDTLMQKLSKLYKKNSLPGFEDKSHDENEIEEISFNVTKYFQKCYNIVKSLTRIFEDQILNGKRLKHDELIIVDNLQKKYAQKIQIESNKFRVLQNSYLKFLNKDDLKPILPKIPKYTTELLQLEEEEDNSNVATDTQRDIESYSRLTLQKQQQAEASQRFLNERDEEIKQLAKGVLEVSTIFREMQNLIIDQGTIVDRIDYNLENTVIELKQADKEINKAVHYQKRTQKCKIILLLSLCVLALFFFVMLKPHGGKTRIIEKPVPQSPTKGSGTQVENTNENSGNNDTPDNIIVIENPDFEDPGINQNIDIVPELI